jgi:hypothetical protein
MDIIIKNVLIIINNKAINIKFYFYKNNKLTKLKFSQFILQKWNHKFIIKKIKMNNLYDNTFLWEDKKKYNSIFVE